MATDTATNGAGLDTEPQEPHEGEDGFHVGELLIEGDGQLSFAVKGAKKPTAATLTITGGKFNTLRSFNLDDRLTFTISDDAGETVFSGGLVIRDVGFVEKEDSKTGQVVSVERRHKGRVTN